MSTSKPEAAAGGQQLQKYQTEMLGKLRALRDSLESERAPFMKMQAERDQAVAAKKEVNACKHSDAWEPKESLFAL